MDDDALIPIPNALVDELNAASAAIGRSLEKIAWLGEYGWTLPMMMTPRQLARIVAIDDAASIDAAFVEFYSSRGASNYRALRTKLLRSSELSWWRDLLTQCFRAYERRDYLIVVPSLLTVLEGAIAAPDKAKFVRAKDRVTFFEGKVANAIPNSMRHYIWRSMDAFIKALFQHSDFSNSPTPERLNRHWILHGRDVPDWDASDCLRLFQAIDTVGGSW